MALSTIRSGSKNIAREMLEIIDVSFQWYVIGLLAIIVVNIFTKGLLTRTGVSVGALIIFVAISGVLKGLYRFDELTQWLVRVRTEIRLKGIGLWLLIRMFIAVELILNFLSTRVLKGQPLTIRLPALAMGIFSWLLLVYLGLLLVEEFQKGWVVKHLHVGMYALLLWAVVSGAAAIILQPRGEPIEKNRAAAKGMGWKDYGWIVLLAIGGGALVYLKFKTLGWLAMIVSGLALVLIFLLTLLILREEQYVEPT